MEKKTSLQIDTYPIVEAAIPAIGAMVCALTPFQKDAIDRTVAAGGNIEIRIRIGADFPAAKVFICQANGDEVELDHLAPLGH